MPQSPSKTSHHSPDVISNFSMMCLLLWQQKPWNEFCHHMFHAKVLHQHLGHSTFWKPQISFQVSLCRSPISVDCSPSMSDILRCSACCRPSSMWITFNRFSTIFETLVPHFYLCCTHSFIPKNLRNHLNSFCGEMFKLNAKFGADSLLYSLSHFECNGHTVHMLT